MNGNIFVVVFFLCLFERAVVSSTKCDMTNAFQSSLKCRLDFGKYSNQAEFQKHVVCCTIQDTIECLKRAFTSQGCANEIYTTLTLWGLAQIRDYVICVKYDSDYCKDRKI